MRLNKIEKIVIAVLLTAGILALGIIMFALPAYQGIEKNNKALTAAQKELDDINTTLLRKDTIDKEISDVRESAEKLEGSFYPDLTPYEADEIVQAYLKANSIEVKGISVTSLATKDITVTAFNTTEIIYQLKTYSQAASSLEADAAAVEEQTFAIEYDENGNIRSVNGESIASITDDLKALIKRAHLLELTATAQTTAVIEVGVDGNCKYGDFLKFVDYISDLERATYLPKVEFTKTTDADVKTDPNAPAQAATQAAKRVEVTDDTDLEFSGLTLILYCVEPMGVNELETIEVAGEQIVVNQ